MSVTILYQGLRSPLCSPTVDVTGGGSTTSAVAGTWRFWLQGRNRSGYNVFSSAAIASLTPGSSVVITIPGDCRRDGEDIHAWVLSATKDSADPTAAQVVAKVNGYDEFGNLTALPATITLSRDAHFGLGVQVNNEAQLPIGSDRLMGMRRYIDSTALIKEWNGQSWESVFPQSFSTYLFTASDVGGALRSVRLIDDDRYVTIPAYPADDTPDGIGEMSPPVGYWIRNDSAVAIASGTGLAMRVTLGTKEINSGFIRLRFLGYTNTLTGELDIDDGFGGVMNGVGSWVGYSGELTGLRLPKDLPQYFAYTVEVAVQTTRLLLSNEALDGEIFRFDLGFFLSRAAYNPLAALVNSFIGTSEDRRRILPNTGLGAIALPGSGNISGYIFQNAPRQEVSGFLANSANQNIVLTNEGFAYVSGVVPDSTGLRAIASTTPGTGRAIAPKPIALNGSQNISVSVNYPNRIRHDYPDVIAGSTMGRFNATRIRILVRKVGETDIRQYSEIPLVGASSGTFVVGGDNAPTIVSSLPTPSPEFGLYEPTSDGVAIAPVSGSSILSAGDYEVSVAFYFEGTITSITHSPERGCLPEQVLLGGGSASDGGVSLGESLILALHYS